MTEQGACLVIRSDAPDAQFVSFVENVAGSHDVVCAARLHEVEALEPGTSPAHTLVIEFPGKAAAREAWPALPLTKIARPNPPRVLLTSTVPEEGFEDPSIPTKANTRRVDSADPVLMLIEGTASDQEKMNAYRDILLPMMFDRQAYYSVFELGGAVEVLSGDWEEAIFAISRWPSRAAAHDFWLSAKYQNEAIPLRLGIGRFQVALLPDRRA